MVTSSSSGFEATDDSRSSSTLFARIPCHARGFSVRNVQRFRGGLVFKAHRLCVALNSRLESNKEEEELDRPTWRV